MLPGSLEPAVRAARATPTRRAVMRGLAGVLAASGLGVALASESDARGRNRRRRRRRECNRANQCKAPQNPCQEARCKNHRCRRRAVADGTICGDGLVCENASCVCPNGVCTVQVTAGNLNSWHGIGECGCEEVDDSILEFRTGPGSPPYGPGSVELTAPITSGVGLGTFQFANTPLNQITALKYSTFQPITNDGPATQLGYLAFGIDFFGSNSIFPQRLVFDPAVNGEPVAKDIWQEWDGIAGGAAKWYYQGDSFDWPNTNPPVPDSDPLTWSEIIQIYPNARISFLYPLLQISLEAYDDPFTEAINSVTFGTASGTTRFVFG